LTTKITILTTECLFVFFKKKDFFQRSKIR